MRREGLLFLAVGLVAGVAVFWARHDLAPLGLGFLQGLAASFYLAPERRPRDTPGRALLRLALLSPVLAGVAGAVVFGPQALLAVVVGWIVGVGLGRVVHGR